MPMYEYECAACHKRTEKIQKFADAPLTVCPHCGEPRLERTITAPAFQFAGGGWYKDGYASAKPAGSEGASSDAAAAAAPAAASPAASQGTGAAAPPHASASSAPAPASAPAAPAAPAKP